MIDKLLQWIWEIIVYEESYTKFRCNIEAEGSEFFRAYDKGEIYIKQDKTNIQKVT